MIFCAAARSVFTADLLRVEDRGVMNVVKALQVRASDPLIYPGGGVDGRGRWRRERAEPD